MKNRVRFAVVGEDGTVLRTGTCPRDGVQRQARAGRGEAAREVDGDEAVGREAQEPDLEAKLARGKALRAARHRLKQELRAEGLPAVLRVLDRLIDRGLLDDLRPRVPEPGVDPVVVAAGHEIQEVPDL